MPEPPDIELQIREEILFHTTRVKALRAALSALASNGLPTRVRKTGLVRERKIQALPSRDEDMIRAILEAGMDTLKGITDSKGVTVTELYDEMVRQGKTERNDYSEADRQAIRGPFKTSSEVVCTNPTVLRNQRYVYRHASGPMTIVAGDGVVPPSGSGKVRKNQYG